MSGPAPAPESRGATSLPSSALPGSRRRVAATWVAYVVLLTLSIPWYFPAGGGEPLVLGLPLWCFVSLGCYVLVAALTVWRVDSLWEAGHLHCIGTTAGKRRGG